jgi:hypothetical protein
VSASVRFRCLFLLIEGVIVFRGVLWRSAVIVLLVIQEVDVPVPFLLR